MGWTTDARLEKDTWFAEPKRFIWYLVLSCLVLQRLKRLMSNSSSRDLGTQETPLTGT